MNKQQHEALIASSLADQEFQRRIAASEHKHRRTIASGS